MKGTKPCTINTKPPLTFSAQFSTPPPDPKPLPTASKSRFQKLPRKPESASRFSSPALSMTALSDCRPVLPARTKPAGFGTSFGCSVLPSAKRSTAKRVCLSPSTSATTTRPLDSSSSLPCAALSTLTTRDRRSRSCCLTKIDPARGTVGRSKLATLQPSIDNACRKVCPHRLPHAEPRRDHCAPHRLGLKNTDCGSHPNGCPSNGSAH